jgi:hypothetical protein
LSTSTVETSEATEASSVTSQASIEIWLGLLPFGLRLVPNTLKPARTKASALAWPMPDEAPVTRAVFFEVEFIIVSKNGSARR